jgi:tetratricopeptide (TPR) repeat protein
MRARKKPSERLKKPTNDGFNPEDNPLEILRKKLFRWLNNRLGGTSGALLVAIFAAAFALWVNWGGVTRLPGMNWVLTQSQELRSMPHAKGDRFSIVIAEIGNDENGAHRRLIADALQGRFGDEVELLLPDRRISIVGEDRPQEVVKAGHARAQVLLRDANADVMIWGVALDNKTTAPIRLHWTVNTETKLRKSSERYLPDQLNYDLPELFWNDLGDVLGLLVSTQAATFSGQRGRYIADQVEPFIRRVSLLIANGRLIGQKQAYLQIILGDALQTLGDQRGDAAAIQKAVDAYREALKEYTRERVPLDWAMTQNNLGNALTAWGVRESGTARLEEALAAYREALKERTRERVPLDWATTQNNLGNALWALGVRESRTARLEEALAAYREALKERTRERVPFDWAITKRSLQEVEKVLASRKAASGLPIETNLPQSSALSLSRRSARPGT